MSPWLVRTLLYPLHERLRGRSTLPLLREFRRTESMSAREQSDLVDRRVSSLLEHAAREVPYWRCVLAGAGARDGVAGLGGLPVMTKTLIREEGAALVADSWRRRVFRLATGGSSGEPLIFFTDKVRESSQLAAKARAREWWGIRLGDRQMDIWGSPIEISANDRVRVWKDRLLNFRMLSAFELSDAAMAGFRSALEAHRTDYVYGYASVLARHARFLEGRAETLHHLGLKGAVSTAEALFPDQREVIERVYGCPVINEYGCRDGGYIAQECPAGGMHLAVDTVVVEILDESDRPVEAGEVGEIAITNLWSFGMPLIRYKLGDRASLASRPCPCGRQLPLLDSLAGRVTDTLFTQDGNRVHGLGLMYVLRVLPGVARFQVIQDELDHVEILIVPTRAASADDLVAPVTAGVRQVLGAPMRVDVRLVESIPVLPSGKMRSVLNRLDRT